MFLSPLSLFFFFFANFVFPSKKEYVNLCKKEKDGVVKNIAVVKQKEEPFTFTCHFQAWEFVTEVYIPYIFFLQSSSFVNSYLFRRAEIC